MGFIEFIICKVDDVSYLGTFLFARTSRRI